MTPNEKQHWPETSEERRARSLRVGETGVFDTPRGGVSGTVTATGNTFGSHWVRICSDSGDEQRYDSRNVRRIA